MPARQCNSYGIESAAIDLASWALTVRVQHVSFQPDPDERSRKLDHKIAARHTISVENALQGCSEISLGYDAMQDQ